MIIKVCGMRDPENIRAVEECKPDMMGFICWDGSRRNVTERPSYLPSCKRVGVFVDPDLQYVKQMVDMLSLDYIQLHGKESASLCESISRETGLPIIKAFSIGCKDDIQATETYDGVAELFLFDTKCPGVGGSGLQFDWNILSNYHGNTPFLLSGGIGPGDEERLRAWHHPLWAGIDLNSRFEHSPAIKDAPLLREFLGKLKPC